MNRTVIEVRQYHLLAVEDDTSTLHLIASTLQSSYRVSIAKTLERARALLQEYRFDLVLLDVNLPDGSGFDLCREIVAANDLYQPTHVIFMTGLTSTNDEVTGLSLGAADYIHKPLIADILRARVRIQTQLIRRTELLASLVHIDSLTEIPNRRAFDESFLDEWNRAKRHQKPLSLAMIDIDHFKHYNDQYGHPAGDSCIQVVADVLNQSFQRGSDLVARYGGEEFAVLLPETDYTEAQALFDAARENLNKKNIEHRDSPVHPCVTFSAGVCTTVPGTGDDDPDTFLRHADALLYQAKARGRARTCSDQLPHSIG